MEIVLESGGELIKFYYFILTRDQYNSIEWLIEKCELILKKI